MADIAALNLQVNSDSVEQANVALREMPKAATAAERAAQRWGTTTNTAARSADVFSKRVQGTVKSLEFERQQLTRSAVEQAKYIALKRAGVAAASAEGQAIAKAVVALNAQRVAIEKVNDAQRRKDLLSNTKLTGGGGIASGVARLAAPIAAGLSVREVLLAADAYTKFTNQLKVAGTAGGDMEEVQRRLFAAAQRNGVEIEALGTLYSRTAQVSAELGVSQEQMLKFADGVTAALRVQGGSAEQSSGALLQLSQALGAGIVRAEEFNSILEGALPIAQAAARGMDGMGGSVAKLRAAIIAGNVTSKQFFDATMKGFAETEKQAAGMALTVGQASTNLETSWIKLVGAGDKLLGISGLVSGAIGGIASVMERLASNTERANKALASLPKDASLWERLDAVFGQGGTFGAMRLGTPAEMAEHKLGLAQKRLAELNAQRAGASGAGARTLEDQISKQSELVKNLESADRRAAMEVQNAADKDRLLNGGLPARSGPPIVRPAPVAGKGGGSNPYKTAIESAKDYIAQKKAEASAIGQSVIVAARMTHEQELLNKATGDNKVLTAQQIANIKGLAQAMAEADAAFASAKFMDDAATKSKEFVAAQEIEQKTLFMSAEAAMAYRLEQEALNDAKAKGIELTDQQKQKLLELAQAQAAAAEKTNQIKDAMEFAKDVTKGFFADIRSGVEEGKSALEIFGNAFLNVLDKIASKLLDMALNDIFSGGNSSGGFINAIGGILGGLFGGGGEVFGPPIPAGFANGAAFNRGNVIPFARGGIVDRPTVFPFARGVGLMGEAGPEAIMPLRRGRNGSLGVQMQGGGGQQPVVVYVTGDTDLVRVTANQEAVKVVTAAAPKIESSAVRKSTRAAPSAVSIDHAERGGDYRT